MRYFALLAILLAACSSKIGDNQPGAADARPIDFRDPPEPKEGSGTAAGCNGVTARGECTQGTAVRCELDRGRLRRVDCRALGQNCILDISHGAVCKSLEEEDTGEGSGAASACTDTGTSEAGFCTTAGVAVYCDTTGDEPVTRTWNCSDNNMTCGVGDCREGAFCCGNEGSTSDEDPCIAAGLDFNGTCDPVGEVARWCFPGSEPQVRDCALTGQRCEEDTCATGAFCCGEVEITGDLTPEEECAALGLAGICDDDLAKARYCLGGEVVVDECEGTETCLEDECVFGAGCCEPPEEPSNECEAIGYDGVCDDADTLRVCYGDIDADIETESCGEGWTCKVDADGYADCEEVIDPCADLGVEGTCPDDNTLHYCLSGELSVINCADQNKTCRVNACLPGAADCCE
ncbi:MAG: hypothetical protein GY811_17830 [Myxococcales bacterium]|nr:hypothetical protein [Myxococcales bacterium]